MCGLERNRGEHSTLRTRDRSLTENLGAGGVALLGFTDLAAFWVVYELFLVEEELLSSRENELGIAVNARQNLVSKFHGVHLCTHTGVGSGGKRPLYRQVGDGLFPKIL